MLLTGIFTFTSREFDPESSLYYYRARYYDPMEGRFIQKDPISFAGGDVNLYGYVQNNPINWIDPYGLAEFDPGNTITRVPIGGGGGGGAVGGSMGGGGAAAGRSGALRQALRDNGVPTSKPPNSQCSNTDKRGNRQPGRQYNYTDSKGNNVTIQDDAGGHRYPDDPSQNRGPHFNGPDGTHYDY